MAHACGRDGYRGSKIRVATGREGEKAKVHSVQAGTIEMAKGKKRGVGKADSVVLSAKAASVSARAELSATVRRRERNAGVIEVNLSASA